jgi:hypothetical protein
MAIAPATSYLIVEGSGDVAFFKYALAKLTISHVAVEEALGNGGLHKVLKAVSLALRPTSEPGSAAKIAVVFDADKNHDAYWTEYTTLFATLGLPVPTIPGEWAVGEKDGWPLQTMLYLLPSPSQPGAIETLLLATLVERPGYGCVDELVKCWIEAGIIGEDLADRVRMQAWLSQYADKKYIQLKSVHDDGRDPWDLTHPRFAALLGLLRTL